MSVFEYEDVSCNVYYMNREKQMETAKLTAIFSFSKLSNV